MGFGRATPRDGGRIAAGAPEVLGDDLLVRRVVG